MSLYAMALPVRDVLTRRDERAEKVDQAVIAISGIEMAITLNISLTSTSNCRSQQATAFTAAGPADTRQDDADPVKAAVDAGIHFTHPRSRRTDQRSLSSTRTTGLLHSPQRKRYLEGPEVGTALVTAKSLTKIDNASGTVFSTVPAWCPSEQTIESPA